jgi:parvulin-like peptidyl-prolyl isomerase
MRKSAAGFVAIAIVAFGVLVAQQSGAFSLRELLGLEPAEEPGAAQAAENKPEEAGRDWGKPAGAGPASAIELADIEKVLANLDGAQRQALLAEEEGFRRFVHQEADNRSVLSAAQANKLQDDANVQYLMQRAAENVLRETYLARLVAAKIPADFPTEAQTREYFEKNKDKFVLGERVHVWQIYLPIEPAQDQKATAAAKKQADALIAELNQGKTDFAAAAAKYSAHEPSSNNGGYMGLVKVSDLKPEIGKPLLAAGEDKLVGPIVTDNGIHILKRGARVPEQPLAYAEIDAQIRELLLKQARVQLRQAIYDQARKTYPVEVKDAKVEEWRLRLRTNLQSTAAAADTKPKQ